MKALFTQRFDAARTALTQGDEPAAAESLHWAIVAARGDSGLRRELASALFHLGKLSRKFGRAGEAEAETLLNEALAISEELFGSDHVALVPLLNELSKLHVQRAQHERAQHVLERLLAIARAKGDENADAAIALAGLAGLKRKLGDEASAEALYRDALRIREKVLESDHMLTVVTREQLSETCAARGKFAEALALLQRSLLTREASLGPGHDTVRVVRSRIAELELQVAIAADTAAVAATRAARGPILTPAFIKTTPDTPPKAPPVTTPTPTNSDELEFLGEPEPQARPSAPPAPEPAKTPEPIPAVAAASLTEAPIQTPAATAPPVQTPSVTASPVEAPSTPHIDIDIFRSIGGRGSGSLSTDEFAAPLHDTSFTHVAHSDVTSSDVASGDFTFGDSAPADRRPSLALFPGGSSESAPKKRNVLYVSAGVAAAVIAIVALMLKPSAGGGSNAVSKEQGATPSSAQHNTGAVTPVVTVADARTGSAATGVAPLTGATHPESIRSASPTPAPTAPAGKPEQRAPDSAPAEIKVPRVQIRLGNVNIPNSVPSLPAAPNVDSIVRSAAERQRASDTERAGSAPAARAPAAAPADADEMATPPKIVGRPPAPRFPDALLRSAKPEGQVLVRFKVNERGDVDVASMIVVQSDHELFTDAVRDILPRFHFEPARTRAPESKAISAWVTVPFRFKARP